MEFQQDNSKKETLTKVEDIFQTENLEDLKQNPKEQSSEDQLVKFIKLRRKMLFPNAG